MLLSVDQYNILFFSFDIVFIFIDRSMSFSDKKMRQLSLSNNTIMRRFSDMFADMKEQVLEKTRSSPLFSFQVESTDISSCSQLIVFVRYNRVTLKKIPNFAPYLKPPRRLKILWKK